MIREKNPWSWAPRLAPGFRFRSKHLFQVDRATFLRIGLRPRVLQPGWCKGRPGDGDGSAVVPSGPCRRCWRVYDGGLNEAFRTNRSWEKIDPPKSNCERIPSVCTQCRLQIHLVSGVSVLPPFPCSPPPPPALRTHAFLKLSLATFMCLIYSLAEQQYPWHALVGFNGGEEWTLSGAE